MDGRYQVRVNCPGANNPMTQMVVDTETGRFLGAFGGNYYRSWVFPLYTPAGLTVVQEFAFDHPFHNGIFVGQHPVRMNGRTGNFWVAPPRRMPDDPLYVDVGRMDALDQPSAEPHANGVRFTLRSVWRDPDEQPLLDEVRTVDLFTSADATVCDVTSRKIARYGPVEFPQTKYGCVGARVEPRLLPPLGGIVHADAGRRGDASILQNFESDFVAYESGPASLNRIGILLRVPVPGIRGPWFIRDYGMAMYNPTWTRSITIPRDGEWSVQLRAVAFDGPFAESRYQIWSELPPCSETEM